MSDLSKFEALGLTERTLEAIRRKGFEEPTPIQERTIPIILKNEQDVIGQAQTGTGKTAAFGLPILENVDLKDHRIQALVLAPTRELAIQVSDEMLSLSDGSGLHVVPVYGGQSFDTQLRRLRKSAHVVVGTPGRLIDHLQRGTINLDGLQYLILDEADEMLNMGFVEEIERILEFAPEDKRTILFSATMPDRIRRLAENYMGDYELVKVKSDQLTASLTEQIYYEVRHQDKLDALSRILDLEENFFGVVFCRTRNDVDAVTAKLQDRGYDADALHGDLSQVQREKILMKLRKKRINILVATDVAARGIDIADLTHVINYSLPQNTEAYVHRIGRTGRAGKKGTAIIFITPSEYRKLMFLQREVNKDIQRGELPHGQEVADIKKQQFRETIEALVGDENKDELYQEFAANLLETLDAKELVAALVQQAFGSELAPDHYRPVSLPPKGSGNRNNNRSDGGVNETGNTRLFISKGSKDGLDRRGVLDLITEKSGVERQDLFDVSVSEIFSFVTARYEVAQQVLQAFQEDEGKRPLVEVAGKKGGGGSKGPRGPRRDDRGGFRGDRRGGRRDDRRGGERRESRGGDRERGERSYRFERAGERREGGFRSDRGDRDGGNRGERRERRFGDDRPSRGGSGAPRGQRREGGRSRDRY